MLDRQDEPAASIFTTSDPPEYTQDGEDHTPTSPHFDEWSSGLPSPGASSNSDHHYYLQTEFISRRYSQAGDSRSPPPLAKKYFTYELQKKGQTWAELKVAGDDLISKKTPTLIEGSRIEGEVKLSAIRAEGIHSVVVSVRGQIVTGARTSERLTFFETPQTLWSRSMGNPQNPTSRCDSSCPPFTKKLQGSFTWSYSIEIPKQVVVASGTKGGPRVFKPPESFWERHGRASVCYEVCVRFVRGRFRPDDRIHAAFRYIPTIIPDPPSPLRQLAYWQGTPLLGPNDDPDGWRECRTARVKGRLHQQRNVEFHCILSLAKPLAYTRGSVIPCWLTLQSDDAQALDSVISPEAIVTRLQRCVKAAAGQTKSIAWRDQTELSELGIWWPVRESMYERELSGELHLKTDLKPSSAMAHFRIEYSVVLFPFDTLVFEPEDTGPLIEQPVEIMTGYAPGPRPRMYVPPEYESPDRVVVDSLCQPVVG